MVWDSFPATLSSQVPVANAKLSIGLKVAASLSLPHPCILADNAAADGNIIAVRPTPPSSRRAANASNSILGIQWPSIALRPSPPFLAPPHFPVAYLRNGQQRNNYLRPFYFAKTDFPIPLFTAD